MNKEVTHGRFCSVCYGAGAESAYIDFHGRLQFAHHGYCLAVAKADVTRRERDRLELIPENVSE